MKWERSERFREWIADLTKETPHELLRLLSDDTRTGFLAIFYLAGANADEVREFCSEMMSDIKKWDSLRNPRPAWMGPPPDPLLERLRKAMFGEKKPD